MAKTLNILLSKYNNNSFSVYVHRYNTLFFMLLIICFFTNINVGLTNSDKSNNINSHFLQFGATGTLNATSSDRLILFNNFVTYKATLKRLEFNANTRWIYGMKKAGLSNNDFQNLVDANYFHDKRKTFNSWALGTFTSSYALNIYDEYQIGLGLAYKVLDTPQTHKFYLRISNGLLFENSNFLNTEGSKQHYSTIRNSLRVQANFYLLDSIFQLRTTTFWQPSLNRANDYNFKTLITLQIPLYKELKFETRYEYNFISRTARENTFLSYGLSFKKEFTKKTQG